ncbi:MAG: hypothetical protein ABIT16_05460 [Croceibacterium sp.]
MSCIECGSNRLKFPKASDDPVQCDDCGESLDSPNELERRIVRGKSPGENRNARQARHATEVANSHEKLRASVAETDRLIVESNNMIQRHRRESDDGGE